MSGTESQPPPSDDPELVIGLIGPLGTDLDLLNGELEAAFSSVAYKTKRISLIEPVLAFSRWAATPKEPFERRYHKRMDAGNEFRAAIRRKDALACLAVAAIQRHRKEFWKAHPEIKEPEKTPAPRLAYLLRSLKTPEEVETLRRIYGPNFVAVGAYTPRRVRTEAMMRQIAHSAGDPETRRHEDEAAKLIARDEFELKEFGQNIRETFPLADVFLDVSNRTTAARDCLRFVEILFGHPSHTPKRAEAAMFHAYGAKMRSSSAGRQVGSAVVNANGEVLAVGTNEVAKAHGGQYWSDDEDDHDQRDHQRSTDSTTSMLSSILQDLLARMQRRGWLSAEKSEAKPSELRDTAKAVLLKKINEADIKPEDLPSLGDKALLEKLIEYMRSVHAEMAALTTCARLGIRVQDCDMYVTTFPCHECARLIVAAGIANVYFIEPYPKSRVVEMYDDSINVDGPGDKHHIAFRAFVGVAPRRFVEFFEAPEIPDQEPRSAIIRRNKDGSWVRWEDIRNTRWPRRSDLPVAIVTRELAALDLFNSQITEAALH